MSLQNSSLIMLTDSEQLVAVLLPNVLDAVRWAYLRHQRRICPYDLDDLSQEIILRLIEDDCLRLRSFKCQSSLKTWLQTVVNHHVYNYFRRRKQTESLNEVNHEILIYSPLQDQEIDIAEKQKLLLRALGKLSEQERLPYQLLFVSELDADKIAAVFETEVKVIYKRKQMLVLKLKRLVRILQSHRVIEE